MSLSAEKSLPAELASIKILGSGVKLRNALLQEGRTVFESVWENLDDQGREDSVQAASELIASGVSTVSILDVDYPNRLRDLNSPPPMLFLRGNRDLLKTRGVGMCGSRDVSNRGLRAAESCAQKAVQKQFSVISGYARGVDTEAHRESLESGGATIVVLAEGITRFRVKRTIKAVLDWDRALVISQFAPNAAWSPGNAMTRNGIIAALGELLVVVDAGVTGGTINAGRQGLATGRRVVAIDYSRETPSGTRQLISEGAISVSTAADFASALDLPPIESTVDAPGQSAMF